MTTTRSTATSTLRMRLTQHALLGMAVHRATHQEVDELTTSGRRHRRGDLAVCTSATSDLRVLINPASNTVVAIWRGRTHDGPWRTALAGRPHRHRRTLHPSRNAPTHKSARS